MYLVVYVCMNVNMHVYVYVYAHTLYCMHGLFDGDLPNLAVWQIFVSLLNLNNAISILYNSYYGY